jgi:succinate-semialdehyde dehydrogenase/glutarate-semialdehyde dehydrogenase
MAYQSINPANGRLVESFDNLTDRQLEEKLEAAAICFQSFRDKPAARRNDSSLSTSSPTHVWSGFLLALSALKAGDPRDERTTLGPLSSEAALLQLLEQVEGAVAHGAKLLIGGKRVDRKGSYLQPTILTDIAPENPAFREEFFGPVALFFRVKDEEAAIALANDSDFGLGGSVFTGDVARGERVASRIETGMMFVNNLNWSDAELPFGGVKESGYGRELCDMGIQQFVNRKLVRTGALEAPR